MGSRTRKSRILLTGGNGYIGTLLLTSLLAETNIHIFVLLRQQHSPEALLELLRRELSATGDSSDANLHERITIIPFESFSTLTSLLTRLRGQVNEIIHAAGSVDYYDADILETANVEFTRHMLDVGRILDVNRFIYVSTAFSCGYSTHVAGESLHLEPPADPTCYTASKRKAEHLVVESGLPFLILRPGVVIGDSRTGRYIGKRYGLYQFLVGTERLLCGRRIEDLHAVVSDIPLQFVHQDMLQQAFLSVWRKSDDTSFVNIVPRNGSSPNLRDLWGFWSRECVRAERVTYYSNLDEVPLRQLDSRMRAFLTFASINTEIAAHSWRFSTAVLDELVNEGLEYTDPTMDSVTRCMAAFLSESSRCQKHIEKHYGNQVVSQSSV